MKKTEQHTEIRSLSELLLDVRDNLKSEQISMADLLEAFHERGFGFFLFLFALPAALPLPGLGINIIVAIPLLLLSVQMALGRRTVWFPEKLKARTIARKDLHNIIDAALPWLKRLEILIRPRLGFITQGIASNLVGAFAVLMALAVCVPLPLTNTVPSFGIALMAVGLLMRDGLAVLAGASIGTFWIAALAFLGQTGLKALIGVII